MKNWIIITLAILLLIQNTKGSMRKESDEYMKWGSVDQYVQLEPDAVYDTGFSYTQGMACDGEYLYVAYRENNDDTEPISIAKIRMSDMEIVETHLMTEGHYNNLYYYEGKIYASGPAVITDDEEPYVDYTKVAVIDASTFDYTIKKSPSCWGVGVRKFPEKGYVTAFVRSYARDILFYDSHIQDDTNKQQPLTRITLDYTGCASLQGSFHMTDYYIWSFETAYGERTLESGHQVVRCFSYSGMMIKAFYLDSIVGEFEDIWVSDDNHTMYMNTIEGKIYKFTLPGLYHTLASSLYTAFTLKQGTLKHIYTYPTNLDTVETFSVGDKTYSVTTSFPLSDYTFLNEIGEVNPPTLWVNNQPSIGNVGERLGNIWFSGSFMWKEGSTLSWTAVYSRRQEGKNYYYYLSSLNVRGYNPNTKPETQISFNVTSTDGDPSSDKLTEAFEYLYTNGWLYGDFYIEGLSYIVGIPSSSSDLGILEVQEN